MRVILDSDMLFSAGNPDGPARILLEDIVKNGEAIEGVAVVSPAMLAEELSDIVLPPINPRTPHGR